MGTGNIAGFRGRNGDIHGRFDAKLPVPNGKTAMLGTLIIDL
jgi:hypothetical protein